MVSAWMLRREQMGRRKAFIVTPIPIFHEWPKGTRFRRNLKQ